MKQKGVYDFQPYDDLNFNRQPKPAYEAMQKLTGERVKPRRPGTPMIRLKALLS